MTKAWDTYETTIKSRYAQHTLATVRQMMIDEFGFKASTRAYRGRLDRWGVTKYNVKKCKDRARSQESTSSSSGGVPSTSGPSSPTLHRLQQSSNGGGDWEASMPQGVGGGSWSPQSNQEYGTVGHQDARSGSHDQDAEQLPTPQQSPYHSHPTAPYWSVMHHGTSPGNMDHGDGYRTSPHATTDYSSSYPYPLGHDPDGNSVASVSNAGSPVSRPTTVEQYWSR